MTSPLTGLPLCESPLFPGTAEQAGLSEAHYAVAKQLNTRGYAVIDFPDPEIIARIDRIVARMKPNWPVDFDDPQASKLCGDARIQDAWQDDEDVRAIAANAGILDILSKVYGRWAFPFQTLNFPVGTQQPAHSDAVHFSSQPERFMCGVWVAFEDIHADAGPLVYYPGSHKWPIMSNALIGRRGWQTELDSAQTPFEPVWAEMIAITGCEPEVFLAKKGQALIWSANLLHGGSVQNDPSRTRWSQVTHYYFEDCIYYTPAFSDEPVGRLALRTVRNIQSGQIEQNRYLGESVEPVAARPQNGLAAGVRRLAAKIAGA